MPRDIEALERHGLAPMRPTGPRGPDRSRAPEP
jgi:hypothetical protein